MVRLGTLTRNRLVLSHFYNESSEMRTTNKIYSGAKERIPVRGVI